MKRVKIAKNGLPHHDILFTGVVGVSVNTLYLIF